MSKMMITAAIAAMAFTATAADARQNARQRGVASGQEAKERAATRDLNSQQLAGVAAMPASGMAPSSGMAPTAATPGQAPSDAAAPMTPAAPDAAASPMAPTGEATPQTDAMPTTPPQAPEPR